jgi:hypothetical protein
MESFDSRALLLQSRRLIAALSTLLQKLKIAPAKEETAGVLGSPAM